MQKKTVTSVRFQLSQHQRACTKSLLYLYYPHQEVKWTGSVDGEGSGGRNDVPDGLGEALHGLGNSNAFSARMRPLGEGFDGGRRTGSLS